VSKNEFIRVVEGEERNAEKREKAERVLRTGEKNGDGSWSISEFTAQLSRGHHGRREH